VDTTELALERTDRDLSKTPPHDLEAERALLGAILLEGSTVDLVSSLVDEAAFYRTVHGKVFAVLEEMRRERKPIAGDTLVVELRARGILEHLGGPSQIAVLVEAAAAPTNAEFHARRIAETCRLRTVRRALSEALRFLHESRDPAEEQLAHVQARVLEATRAGDNRSRRDLASLLREMFERLEKRKRGELRGLLTGYPGIDALTRGLQPGEVTVVAARPSVGKSAFALNVARNVISAGTPVAFFSIEMEGVSLTENLVASLARVNTLSLRRAQLNRAEEERLFRAGEGAEPLPLVIDDERPVTLRALRSKSLRLKAEGKLGLLVVDYLQMMEADVRGRNRAEEVAEISRGLKALARDLEVPVMALAQLNRESERAEREPKAHDLRESGSIEADADALLLLHPRYYCPDVTKTAHEKAKDEEQAKEQKRRPNAIDVIVAKARLGEQGRCPLWFDRATQFMWSMEEWS
jgi:replicative DNA helicase